MLVGFPFVDAPDVVPPAATLMAFAGATLAIVALPGTSVAYVVTRSIEPGRRVRRGSDHEARHDEDVDGHGGQDPQARDEGVSAGVHASP